MRRGIHFILPVNRGIPQGTILGPILFSIVVYDIKSVDNSGTLPVKYADDITVSTCRRENYESSDLEVNTIKKWTVDNKMTINLIKTKVLIVRGRSEASLPQPSQRIEQIDHTERPWERG